MSWVFGVPLDHRFLYGPNLRIRRGHDRRFVVYPNKKKGGGRAVTLTPLPVLNEVRGRLAVVAPHMDDEVIGCGALLASLSGTHPISVYFFGEGLGSFSPEFVAERGRNTLMEMRKDEAFRATGTLGISPDRISFGDFQEWQFQRQRAGLRDAVFAWLDAVQPSVVLAPFHLDCHADHTVLSSLVYQWIARHPKVRLLEYFVYYRLRLIPGGDMRRLIRPSHLSAAPSSARFAQLKEKALRAYVSQTTRFDPSWERPVLDEAYILNLVSDTEMFFGTEGEKRSTLIRWHPYARAISGWQFRLKGIRDRLRGRSRRVAGRSAAPAGATGRGRSS